MSVSKGLRVLSILLFLLISGGLASGQCVADGNNSAKTATPLPLSGKVNDWVCPDDPWDYFVIDVPSSAANISGHIIFTAAQSGTTIDISSPSTSSPLFARKGSTDTGREIRIDIKAGDLTPGKYYVRIGFYSSYKSDHSYSLDVALAEIGCKPDNNETPETAWTIFFDDGATNCLGPSDRLDIWKITVNGESEGRGSITLVNDNGILLMSLYDSKKKELFKRDTKNGKLTFDLGTVPADSSGTPPSGYSKYGLAPGDYYIEISVLNDGYETDYRLSTESLPIEVIPGGGIITGIEAVVTPDIGSILGAPGIWVRLVLDSLFCFEESDYDEGTDSDEPYPVLRVQTGNLDTWNDLGGGFNIFEDVDEMESRKCAWENREMFAGEIPFGQALKITIDLYEDDSGTDDTIGTSVVNTIQPDVLQAWSQSENNRTFGALFSGGSEGKYHVRYHLEFNQLASMKFPVRFTNYDTFDMGRFRPGTADDIVIVVDDDAPGKNGRFYFYDGAGNVLKSFDKPYEKFDRVAIGDVDGDGFDEIIVASVWEQRVRGYSYGGDTICDFYTAVFKYDGFAAADIDSDGKCEFIVASNEKEIIGTYSKTGEVLRELKLNWNFRGARYTGPDSCEDAFLVGDVIGNSRVEFVLLRYKLGPHSEIFVYDALTGTVMHHVGKIADLAFEALTFSEHDAVYLADVRGDSRLELLIASDEEDGYAGLIISALDLDINGRVAIYSWPFFTLYDGFAVGDVLNKGSNQILIASDDLQTVFATMN